MQGSTKQLTGVEPSGQVPLAPLPASAGSWEMLSSVGLVASEAAVEGEGLLLPPLALSPSVGGAAGLGLSVATGDGSGMGLLLLPPPAALSPSVGGGAGLGLAALSGDGDGLLLPSSAFPVSADVAAGLGLGLGLAASACDAERTGLLLLLLSPVVLPWFGVGEGVVSLALVSWGGLPLGAGAGVGRALSAGGALVPAAEFGDGSGLGLGLPSDSEGPGEARDGDMLVP